jgi:hypothetical protein
VRFSEALRFVEKNGIVLESAHRRVPTFVDHVAGERVTRWWGHPKGRAIFSLTRMLRDHPDVLTCRLIDRKITFVHRRLWPALVKLAAEINGDRLTALREIHLPSGKHSLCKQPFPRWVPADVISASKRVTRQQARDLLNAVFEPG